MVSNNEHLDRFKIKVYPTVDQLIAIRPPHVTCSEEGCDSAFAHMGSLHMHLVKTHKIIKNDEDRHLFHRMKRAATYEFHCPEQLCRYSRGSERHFSLLKHIKQHYMKVHAARTYKCELCGQGYSTPSSLAVHRAGCGTMFQCGDCPVKYTTKVSLQCHCRRQGHTLPAEYCLPKPKTNTRMTSARRRGALPQVTITQTPIMFVTVQQPATPAHPPLREILPMPVQQAPIGSTAGEARVTDSRAHALRKVKQHAIIQTDIYGVDSLSIRKNQAVHSNNEMMRCVSGNNHVLGGKPAKHKLHNRNIVSPRRKKMKSTTGMQTSMTLLQKVKVKSVMGTQTSGDYILKKAMARADIPIDRKTVASQVTPEKSAGMKKAAGSLCTSETQTCVRPAAGDIATTGAAWWGGGQGRAVGDMFPSLVESETMTDVPPSISTQTLQSYLENLQEHKTGASNEASNYAILSHDGTACETESKLAATQSSFSQSVSEFNGMSAPHDLIHIYQENLASAVSYAIPSSRQTTHKESSKTLDMPDTCSFNPSHTTRLPDTNFFTSVGLEPIHKLLNNQLPLTDTGKNDSSVGLTKQADRKKTLISTTANIVYNPSVAVVSQASTVNNSFIQTHDTYRPDKHICSNLPSATTDADGKRLDTPMQDQLATGSAELGPRTNTEVQTMSTAEFDQLLQSSGIFFNDDNTEYDFLAAGTQHDTENVKDAMPGKKISFHPPMDTIEFDFLNGDVNTIDMNTQTVTDFNLFDSNAFTDMNTQTPLDIDFLDLVMTNMETQTCVEDNHGAKSLAAAATANTRHMAVCTTDDCPTVVQSQTSLGNDSGNSMAENIRNITDKHITFNAPISSQHERSNVLLITSGNGADNHPASSSNMLPMSLSFSNFGKPENEAATDMQTQTLPPDDGNLYVKTNMETQTIFDDDDLHNYLFD